MIKIIKVQLIRLKYFILQIKLNFIGIIKYRNIELRDDEVQKAYIFLAADYGNIGDLAIVYAQKEYIKSIIKNCEIVEIPLAMTRAYIRKLKKIIKPNDIVTIVGGGNMTDRYDSIEEARRMVVKNFKNNTIISFPQTIEFTDSIFGQEAFKRTKKIYSKNSNLILLAREKMSYDIMQQAFPMNKVYLIPDIVMSLKDKVNIDTVRTDKIGVCLRDDKEKNLDLNILELISKSYSKNSYEIMSTYIDGDEFVYEYREKYFFDMLKKIREKSVVITDRLHAMIFCYITNTPCVVFDNDNHKISQSYNKWLKDCNYIKLLTAEQGKDICDYVENMKRSKINDVDLSRKYLKLDHILRSFNKY